MSTKLSWGIFSLLAACLLSPIACGQSDLPPSWSSAAGSGGDLTFPEVPVAPQPVAPQRIEPRTQAPVPPMPTMIAPRRQRLSAESTAGLPKQVQNVIDFYGGSTSARALSQLPNRPSSGMARPAPARQMPKPFEGTVDGAPPTISPYMNLFLEESEEGLPNYYAYVRPAQRQQAANSAARRELHTLDREVRTASYGQAVTPTGGAVPGTGHGTRYFNTSRYYPTTKPLR